MKGYKVIKSGIVDPFLKYAKIGTILSDNDAGSMYCIDEVLSKKSKRCPCKDYDTCLECLVGEGYIEGVELNESDA